MDGSLRIWDGINSQCVRAIEGAHGGAMASSVRITKNEKYLLSAGADATLKMWEIASGKMVMEYKGHQQRNLLLQVCPRNMVRRKALIILRIIFFILAYYDIQ